VFALAAGASAQVPASTDTRTQYPPFLANSYFTFNVGSIRYLFTGNELESGFSSESVDVPHVGVRVDLFGHHFNRYLAAQVTYMRPALFVSFDNVNGDKSSHQVSEAYGGLTFVGSFPLGRRADGYGEGGYGLTSRSGFEMNGAPALKEAHFGNGILGAGVAVHATPNIDMMFSATYSPGRKSFNQPSTRLFTAGIRYEMRQLPESTVTENRDAGYFFPLNTVRFGYTTNLLTYGANGLFTQVIPIFWGGNVHARRGFSVSYERNVFHNRKRFAFDLGASGGYWKSDLDKEVFATASVYPLLRFYLARPQQADLYFAYSVAGPTLISDSIIDGLDTGQHFTFQDFLGLGGYFGASRRFNAELGIKHYSNGNIFTKNASIKIPLTLLIGVDF